jgi:hypothetical protein
VNVVAALYFGSDKTPATSGALRNVNDLSEGMAGEEALAVRRPTAVGAGSDDLPSRKRA